MHKLSGTDGFKPRRRRNNALDGSVVPLNRIIQMPALANFNIDVGRLS
jgi:hypothetical protein